MGTARERNLAGEVGDGGRIMMWVLCDLMLSLCFVNLGFSWHLYVYVMLFFRTLKFFCSILAKLYIYQLLLLISHTMFSLLSFTQLF